MPAFDPLPAIHSIWTRAGLPLSRLPELVLTGNSGPALPSSFRVSELAQITTALSALAASYLHELRTGSKTIVTVDKREAGLEFISEAWTLLDNQPPPSIWDPLAGVYKTADSFVRVHTNFPHHRSNLLRVLNLDLNGSPAPTRETVAAALLEVNSIPFETLATEHKCCVSALRSFEEWDASPQGRDAADRFAAEGAVVIDRDGDKDGRPAWTATVGRVAEGVKVLDMTRVIAGPVGGRTMAVRGAEVLLVTSPNLPDLPTLDLDTTRGKRTTQLDLSDPDDCTRLATNILPHATIFLQSYRPDALATKFPALLSPAALRTSNPNMILASLSAYGIEGPWAGKRGFDSLVQTATGFNHAEGAAYAMAKSGEEQVMDVPRPFPVQALDHGAGQLLAFGMLAALCRQLTDGGTYSIRVSLVSVAYLLRSLGRYDPIADGCFNETLVVPEGSFPPAEEIGRLQQTYDESGIKGDAVGRRLVAIRCAGRQGGGLDEMVARKAPMKLDADEPTWTGVV